jgi:hypothetical protein
MGFEPMVDGAIDAAYPVLLRNICHVSFALPAGAPALETHVNILVYQPEAEAIMAWKVQDDMLKF